MSSPTYARSNSDSSTSSTMSTHQARYQNLLSLAQSGSKVTNADLATPSSEPPQYQRLVQMARSGEKAPSLDEKELDDDTSSIVSMQDFIKRAEKVNVSRRQAVAMKIRQWSAEGKATWKRIEPYYREFQYWVMMGPH